MRHAPLDINLSKPWHGLYVDARYMDAAVVSPVYSQGGGQAMSNISIIDSISGMDIGKPRVSR